MVTKDATSEATKWFVRWRDRSDAVSAKEQSRWIAWLQHSPKHVAEYFAVDDMCTRLSESSVLNNFDVDEWMASRRAQIVPLDAASRISSQTSGRTSDRSGWMRWAAVATVAIVAIGAVTVWQFSAAGDSYRTGIGEQKTVHLADGSSLQMNTRSRVRVRFDEHSREIELKGEALFTVAPDARRPFQVRTNDAIVRAIGTRFNVYEEEDGTRVAVLEGRVIVTSTALNKSLEVGAHEEAQINDDFSRKTAKPDVNAATAWRNRKLVFERATLADVAREFNRYNVPQFRIDPATGEANRLSGTFDARHPESLLLWLQSRTDITVLQQGDVYVVQGIGEE